VGNNTPVFFLRDPLKFPDLDHAVKRDPRTDLPPSVIGCPVEDQQMIKKAGSALPVFEGTLFADAGQSFWRVAAFGEWR
jgi:hypothetical protein